MLPNLQTISQRIVVVDGGWTVGKSTLCHDLCATIAGSVFLQEPSGCPHSAKAARADWYFSEHLTRLAVAETHASAGRIVVMERGLISTIAYNFEEHPRFTQRAMAAGGYDSLKHILLVDWNPNRRYRDIHLGDAREMKKAGERQRYAERILQIAHSSVRNKLIIRGRYHRAIHRDRVREFALRSAV